MIKSLLVTLIAALPISELRGAVPIAIGVYHLSCWQAFLLSYLGNISFIIPVLLFLNKVAYTLMDRSVFWNKFLTAVFKKTTLKTKKQFQRYSEWALVILVAIPLPFTGAWTGTIASFLFGIKWKRAFWLISLGVLIADVIVTGSIMIGVHIIK